MRSPRAKAKGEKKMNRIEMAKEIVADVAFCLIVVLLAVAYCVLTPPQMSAEYDWSAEETRLAVEAEGLEAYNG